MLPRSYTSTASTLRSTTHKPSQIGDNVGAFVITALLILGILISRKICMYLVKNASHPSCLASTSAQETCQNMCCFKLDLADDVDNSDGDDDNENEDELTSPSSMSFDPLASPDSPVSPDLTVSPDSPASPDSPVLSELPPKYDIAVSMPKPEFKVETRTTTEETNVGVDNEGFELDEDQLPSYDEALHLHLQQRAHHPILSRYHSGLNSIDENVIGIDMNPALGDDAIIEV